MARLPPSGEQTVTPPAIHNDPTPSRVSVPPAVVCIRDPPAHGKQPMTNVADRNALSSTEQTTPELSPEPPASCICPTHTANNAPTQRARQPRTDTKKHS